MPGIVDPRPGQEAELRRLQAELAAATDEDERRRLETEIDDLRRRMGLHGGFLRRILFGWAHRPVPW